MVFSSIYLFILVFLTFLPSHRFFLKGWPAWSLVLFTRLFSSQPESAHAHGSRYLEQHGRIALLKETSYIVLLAHVITDFHNLLVRASGQQDVHTRLLSWHWSEVSLWGNFAFNNIHWVQQLIKNYKIFVVVFTVVVFMYFWLFLH